MKPEPQHGHQHADQPISSPLSDDAQAKDRSVTIAEANAASREEQQEEDRAEPTLSPAVRSWEIEQASQRQLPENALDNGLKETFPASDPISGTTTTIAEGRVDPAPDQRLEGPEQKTIRAVPQVPNYLEDCRAWIRKRPLTAVALTAFFVWIAGASR